LTHAALKHSIAIFDGLVVHVEQMRRNLDLTGGLIVAEAVMMHLGEFVGRQQAHDVVYNACAQALSQGRSLFETLLAMPDVTAHIDEARLRQLTDPAAYVGLAPHFVDRVLGQADNG
jgi:3-carboxy-cis,cis-muconate cycloisomerase